MAGRAAALTEVWITDSGVVTAAGDNLEATWLRVLSGKTAIGEINRFSVKGYRSGIGACIPNIRPTGPFSLIHPILEMLLSGPVSVPADCLVITATTKAGIDNLEKLKRGFPAVLKDMSPTSIGDIVRARLGLNGRSLSISAACASAAVAVAQAAALISSGAVETVFVCSIDIVAEFIFSGFSALQNLSPFPCRPFDRSRAGLTPGEGAAFLVLMSRRKAEYLGLSPKGVVAGSGIANDTTHITAPDRTGSGLVRAIKGAMTAAAVQANDISGISAHGTGTVPNDIMELNAFQKVFGQGCPPIYSAKGCIGHTFGAAGGIEIALGLRALEEQTLPPTAGFVHPEKGAEGRVSSKAVAISGDYLLTTNSGFGGVNAAVIVKRGVPL
jgi:3-oxoacyl-[acyl-carrier-protein] synthase II